LLTYEILGDGIREESVKQEDIWREMLKRAEEQAGLSDREKEIERYTKRMVDKVIPSEVQSIINESLVRGWW